MEGKGDQASHVCVQRRNALEWIVWHILAFTARQTHGYVPLGAFTNNSRPQSVFSFCCANSTFTQDVTHYMHPELLYSHPCWSHHAYQVKHALRTGQCSHKKDNHTSGRIFNNNNEFLCVQRHKIMMFLSDLSAAAAYRQWKHLPFSSWGSQGAITVPGARVRWPLCIHICTVLLNVRWLEF